VINFLKQIFTWWHRRTLGTFLYTLFLGRFVGKDSFGNKYYSNSKGKRWVIYSEIIEATKIPTEWHSWIHFLKDKVPNKDIKKFSWQTSHKENLTGTNKAHKPKGSLSLTSNVNKNIKKYETWKP